MAEVNTKVKIDMSEVDRATIKLEHLRELLREAKSLADDLTSQISEIKLNIKI